MKTLIDRLAREKTLLGCVILATITPTAADERPKEFTFSATFSASGKVHSISLDETHSAGRWKGTVITTNDEGEGFLHHMFGDCVELWFPNPENGMQMDNGACTFIDADGNQIFEVWRYEEPGPVKAFFFGGTGKYAGIRCEAEVESLAKPKSTPDGMMLNLGKKQGSCTSL